MVTIVLGVLALASFLLARSKNKFSVFHGSLLLTSFFFLTSMGVGSFWAIVSALFVVIFCLAFKRSSSKRTDASHADRYTYLHTDVDNDEFLIFYSSLREYRGDSYTLVVPQGVISIGNWDDVFCTRVHCLENIYIPKSVTQIKPLDLARVEYVYYEGTEAEWNKIEIGDGNFTTGWHPDYCDYAPNYRVKEVTFRYNVHHSSWKQY